MTTKTNTKTTMPTTKPSMLPLGGISKDKMAQAIKAFSNSETWEADNRYATLQAINIAPNYGFFLKQKDLVSCGWYGLEHNAVETKIRFSSGESEPGFLFQKPRMVIIDGSPRLVEVTKLGEKAYNEAKSAHDEGRPYDPMHLRLGVANSFADIYCNYDESKIDSATGQPYTGADLHNACKKLNYTSLRTFYLVYLLNDEFEMLHATPVVLSIKGLAAQNFGNAVSQFGKAMLSDVSSADSSLKKLGQAKASLSGLRNFYFITHLEGALDGENNNWITRPVKADDGTYLVGGDIITDQDLLDKVNDTAELNDGFAWKYASQMTALCGYHQFSGVLAGELPPAQSHALAGIDVKSEAIPF